MILLITLSLAGLLENKSWASSLTIMVSIYGVIYTSWYSIATMNHMYQLNQIPSEAKIKKYLRRIIFGKNLLLPRVQITKGRSL